MASMTEKLRDLLIQHEGEVNHAYEDSEGYLTIGVGRLIDERKGGGISHEEAMHLLDNDIKTTLGECDRMFDWFDDLDEVRKVVVLNMVFNMGLSNFMGFRKTIYFISASAYESAAKEMLDSKWATQVGRRATHLSGMMESGEY